MQCSIILLLAKEKTRRQINAVRYICLVILRTGAICYLWSSSLDRVDPKRKQTKKVPLKMYYPHPGKDGILLKGKVETKLFPDSALGNFLCNSGYKTKSEKKSSFLLASNASRNWATALGVILLVPKYAQEAWKGSELPPASKWVTLFRENPLIILLQVSSLTLNNLHYILSELPDQPK